MASNPFAMFNNVPSNQEWAKKTQAVLPTTGYIQPVAGGGTSTGTVNLKTWEPQSQVKAPAPKPVVAKPIPVKATPSTGTVNLNTWEPQSKPVPASALSAAARPKPAPVAPQQPAPSPLQQQMQQLQVWNPQRQQQMSFQQGFQQPPYGGQYAPPWVQYQQQPQWGGMSSYYNSMNPWGQMPNPQQMGFNANSAYGQFGSQWQSPFANRPTPNYYQASQMPVIPNLPTQQPQYVQTPWG